MTQPYQPELRSLETKEEMMQEAIGIIRDDLTAGGIVNLELHDDVIKKNISRAIRLMSSYYTGPSYKTIDINKSSVTGGYILLDNIDENGVSVITAVYPIDGILRTDAGLLGLGNIYLSIGLALDNQMQTYANMLTKLSLLESILGRNAKVVGDKLYIDNYYDKVTIEYIPRHLKLYHITDGEWMNWVLEYATALSKRQLAQARGKYTVASSPSQPNASILLEEANNKITELEESMKTKGLFSPSR